MKYNSLSKYNRSMWWLIPVVHLMRLRSTQKQLLDMLWGTVLTRLLGWEDSATLGGIIPGLWSRRTSWKGGREMSRHICPPCPRPLVQNDHPCSDHLPVLGSILHVQLSCTSKMWVTKLKKSKVQNNVRWTYQQNRSIPGHEYANSILKNSWESGTWWCLVALSG